MEQKTIMIITVGSLIGLLVGIASGYFLASSFEGSTASRQRISQLEGQVTTLQNQISQKDNQIQTLQQQVSELENLLGPTRKGAWNLIKSFEGSSYLVNTDYFYVAGTELRINWTWIRPDPEFGSFSIYLYKEGEDVYTENFWNLQESGTTFAHNIIVSYYYLKILGSNLDHWTVTVEVWIPQ